MMLENSKYISMFLNMEIYFEYAKLRFTFVTLGAETEKPTIKPYEPVLNSIFIVCQCSEQCQITSPKHNRFSNQHTTMVLGAVKSECLFLQGHKAFTIETLRQSSLEKLSRSEQKDVSSKVGTLRGRCKSM